MPIDQLIIEKNERFYYEENNRNRPRFKVSLHGHDFLFAPGSNGRTILLSFTGRPHNMIKQQAYRLAAIEFKKRYPPAPKAQLELFTRNNKKGNG